MPDYVETLSPIDVDDTGFTARGRAHGLTTSWIPAIDWSTDTGDLPDTDDIDEPSATHVHADWDGGAGDPREFSKRIDSGPGVFFYRALCHVTPV